MSDSYVATGDDGMEMGTIAATAGGLPSTTMDRHPSDGTTNTMMEAAKLKPKRLWKQFASDTLVAARLHSVDVSERTLHVDPTRSSGGEGDATDTAPPAAVSIASTSTADHPYYLKRLDTFSNIGQIASLDFEEFIPEGGSLGAAVFGIIKGTVGPAILYLPRGFQLSGYAVAVPAMFLATLMYIYNAYRLLACWRVEHEKELQHAQNNNDTTKEQHVILLTYPELAQRAFGPTWSILVDVGIASMQFGVCLTYLIFVPHNLFEVTEFLFGINHIPKVAYLLLMIVLEIPLSWIRDIRKLTPTNVVATGLIAYGLFFVLLLAFVQGMAYVDDYGDDYTRVFGDNLSQLPAITDSWFMFVGTAFFMMEGSITLLVPLQESVLRQEDRAKFPYINQVVTSGIVVFYVLFSIVACGAFGDSIQTAMTASLEPGVLATSIQLAYSIAVILTFPLQAFPAMEVVKDYLLSHHTPHQSIHNNLHHEQHQTTLPWYQREEVQRRALSTIIICILGVIATIAIDYLGNVVSIIGSLFGIPLALVVPPLMHNILVPDSTKTQRRLNNLSVVMGALATGAASFATIVAWDKGAEDVEER